MTHRHARPLSPAAQQAQDAYRRGNGQFGTQPVAETDPFDVLPDPAEDQVPLTAGDSWGALQDAFDAAVRDAYTQGQADAYLRAADLIHETEGPSAALTGHTMRHPDGAYAIAVPDECGYEMADKVLAAASDSLRSHARSGLTHEVDAYLARTRRPADREHSTDTSDDTCPTCGGHGYEREIGDAAGGDTLYAGQCPGCWGEGAVPNTGASVDCPGCLGTGEQVRWNADTRGTQPAPCGVCNGTKTVRASLPDQVEVVVPGHGKFGRISRDETYPTEPYSFRIEANRPLSDAEIRQAAGLFGYNYRAAVAGEPVGLPVRDSDRSFVVMADTTKSSRDDLGVGLDELIDNAPGMFDEGSPVRKTDRAGAGTKGTRLVEGFNDPGLRFDLYADSYDTPRD